MIEESLAHTTWDCTYHIVWIPKYRGKVLYGEGLRLHRRVLFFFFGVQHHPLPRG
jgi:REP element-mobilizing transposase RayT